VENKDGRTKNINIAVPEGVDVVGAVLVINTGEGYHLLSSGEVREDEAYGMLHYGMLEINHILSEKIRLRGALS
jgi:hypothetical protein